MFIFISACQRSERNEVKDIDGNIYQTITIGDNVWMAENLKTTHYRNGDKIQCITDNWQWSSSLSGAYCDYNNDSINSKTYGRLYNWYAVNDKRNLAPKGWHVATDKDFQDLIKQMGGDTIAGDKLKEDGTRHWLIARSDSNHNFGFKALPAGYRFSSGGTFHTLGSNTYWWSTDRSYELYTWSKRIYSNFADVQRDPQYKTYGLSVRCVKDQ